MDRRYKHLDCEERGVIFAGHRRGSNLRQIGRLLGRHASTIGRELVRGAASAGYDPQVARCRIKALVTTPFHRAFFVYAWIGDRVG